MKVLLDVCTPVQVRQALPDHDVRIAVKLGWGELENCDLLRMAEALYSNSSSRFGRETIQSRVIGISRRSLCGGETL
jgi:hypothetical protein